MIIAKVNFKPYGKLGLNGIITQAFKLFSDSEKLTEVAIELEITAKRALRLWSQFLKLERM